MYAAKPGEAYDSRGIPIYPGDLLRSFHFRDGRKNRYLYHVACLVDGYLRLVPTCHLEASKKDLGGCCWLLPDIAHNFTVIHGYGPEFGQAHDERKRRKAAVVQ